MSTTIPIEDKVGIEEVVRLMREMTSLNVRRPLRQKDRDPDIDGIPYWFTKIKRLPTFTRADIRAGWQQTVDRSYGSGLIPVFLFRQDGDEWRAVASPYSLVAIECRPAHWLDYGHTAETSLAVWAKTADDVAANPNAYLGVLWQ